MPSYVNSYFGVQSYSRRTLTDAVLKVHYDGNSIDFTEGQEGAGWVLLGPQGWGMQSSALDTYYADSKLTDGESLQASKFGNVIESWRVGLFFYSADGMLDQKDQLEEWLTIRAPAYWKEPRNHKPVYIERRMPGETKTSYALLSEGRVTMPDDIFDKTCTHDNGLAEPILVTFTRQPFWLGAVPGTTQGGAELAGQVVWDYDLVWAQDTNLPGGDIFCFVETAGGAIFAGGVHEILHWNGTTWNVTSAAPVDISGDSITCAVLMGNGDILFGATGRVIKRTSGNVWSVESALPAGQVWDMVLCTDGVVYAADNGQICKRAADGTWTVDESSLPSGQMYSLVQASNGRVFVGGVGEILAQVTDLDSVDLTPQIAAATDNAEQYGSTCYTNPTVGNPADLDPFNQNYVALRFQLNVPANATINSAVPQFFPRANASGTSGAAKIYFEKATNAAAFTTTDDDISDRTLTTEYVAWQDTVARRRNQQFDGPDVSVPLQEVIDQSGWAANNYVVMIVKCDTLAAGITSQNTRRQCYGYDLNPGKAPILAVTYTAAPVAGAGWEVNTTLPGGNVRSLLQVGDLLLAGEDGQILGTDDLGTSWGVLSTTPTGECRSLYDDGEMVWAGDNGNILRSVDRGRTFASHSTVPTSYVYDFIQETSTDDLRAADNKQILILDESDAVTLGRAATTADEVVIVARHNTSNLTHIKIADGAAFSDIFPATSFPATLLPAVPAENDALYFGVDTSLSDTGPFGGLVFDIGTPASATTSYAITWEYWDSAAWSTLTTHDETSDLSEVGVRCVTWTQPTDWATTAVDGDTGYWVRARVSALNGVLTPPTQANRDIYSPAWAFVELREDQARGNVDSLVKMEIRCRGDEGGPGGSAPLLYFNRVVCGAQEYEDHENFRAYLNFADEQNPTGVTLDVTIDPDSATSEEADTNLSSSTGRRVFFDAGVADGGNGLDNWEDRVGFKLGTSIARDFYGTYKAFLRCKQNGGSAGEVAVRLKVVSGSGGISSVGDTQVTASTTDHELIEFDETLTIPVASQMTNDELGDTTSLIVQIKVSANDADLYLYELVLIPTDKAWFDARDEANTAESSVENGRKLLIDSVTIPKGPARMMVKKSATDSFVASWRPDGNGPARLLAGKRQRLWFLLARTSAAASSTWLSEPEMTVSISLNKTDRWITGRGSA